MEGLKKKDEESFDMRDADADPNSNQIHVKSVHMSKPFAKIGAKKTIENNTSDIMEDSKDNFQKPQQTRPFVLRQPSKDFASDNPIANPPKPPKEEQSATQIPDSSLTKGFLKPNFASKKDDNKLRGSQVITTPPPPTPPPPKPPVKAEPKKSGPKEDDYDDDGFEKDYDDEFEQEDDENPPPPPPKKEALKPNLAEKKSVKAPEREEPLIEPRDEEYEAEPLGKTLTTAYNNQSEILLWEQSKPLLLDYDVEEAQKKRVKDLKEFLVLEVDPYENLLEINPSSTDLRELPHSLTRRI